MTESGRKAEPAIEEVPASEARDRLTEMMDRAALRGERFVLTRNNKPLAVIVGVAELEALDASAVPAMKAAG